MTATITAFDWVPDFAKGLVRDVRVRWALEEVGEPYDVRYLSQGDQKAAPHRALQPFEQVPTFEEDGLALFESGAIVHHIAATRPGLLPEHAPARARAVEWMFAALNSVEPTINDHVNMTIFEADRAWAAERREVTAGYVRDRLKKVAERLGDEDWLEGEFTAGDLMLVGVLRGLRGTGLIEEQPAIAAYVERGEARPAFRRALAAQLAGFTAPPPRGWREPIIEGERR